MWVIVSMSILCELQEMGLVFAQDMTAFLISITVYSKEGSGWLTNFVEPSHSWKASSCSSTQEIPSILCNMKVQCHAHYSLSLAPVLSQMTPVHTTQSYFCNIHFNNFSPPTSGLPGSLYSSDFPNQKSVCMPLLSYVCYMPPLPHSARIDRSNYI